MIVECSNCHTKYNVDENKIPAGGVKVKCQKCQGIILIKKEKTAPQPVKPVPTVPVEEDQQKPVSVPEPPGPSETETPQPQAKTEVEPPQPTPPEPEVPQPEVPAEQPQSEVTTTVSPPTEEMSEEDRKWHTRAKRLAKALASDLVLYNQDKVDEGLRSGTLAQLLGPEIRRSWEYYCQQIPSHIVENTDYFKQQLNKIVGKGREIFK